MKNEKYCEKEIIGERINTTENLYVGMEVVGGVTKLLYKVTEIIDETGFKADLIGEVDNNEIRTWNIGKYHYSLRNNTESEEF